MSKTAKQLLSALATYNILLSSLNARPLVVEPVGESGYKAVLSVSITLFLAKSITETELSLALKYFKIDVRFLGSDYQNLTHPKPITDENAIPIEYIDSINIHSSDYDHN